MKFDVKKAEELLYDSKFQIQDHDNKFQFYGIFNSATPDRLTFYITSSKVGFDSHGTYTFPAGSNFTIHKLKLDVYEGEWIYTPNIISWEDITEQDEEEKEVKLDPWKDFVIKANAWYIDDQIKNGDAIYRLKTYAIDIKGKMTIDSTSYGMLCIKCINSDGGTDIINLDITPDMRVFKTDSNDDPGILVQHQKGKFNPELRTGRLYFVTTSELGLRYLVHAKSITDNSIDVDIIDTIADLGNSSSIKLTSKTFNITELLDYKFKEI